MWRFPGQYWPRPQSARHYCSPWHLRRALSSPRRCLCLLVCRPTPLVPHTGWHVLLLAARPLRLHPSSLPYSTVPAAAAADPVLSSGGSCPRLIPRCNAGHPVPLAVSPPLAVPLCPITLPLLHACPSPLHDHLLPLPTPRVFRCRSLYLSSACSPCTLSVPGAASCRPRDDEDEHCVPAPALPYASPSYHPSFCNSSRSICTLGFFPRSRGQSRLTRGVPLPASSSTGPPPSQAPFPLASPPRRPGR